MALNKNDFVVAINYYKRNGTREDVLNFMQSIGLSKDLSTYLLTIYWTRQSLGGCLWQELSIKKLLPDLTLKNLKITYEVIDTTYSFVQREEKPVVTTEETPRGIDNLIDNSK